MASLSFFLCSRVSVGGGLMGSFLRGGGFPEPPVSIMGPTFVADGREEAKVLHQQRQLGHHR